MNKTKIIVPAGIRFLSEWREFNFPSHPCIIDKKVPGCGFTEYCIVNPDDVILCSPRKVLLKNKTDQHPGEVLYINPEEFGEEDLEVDKEKYKPTKVIPITGLPQLKEVVVENEEAEELDRIKYPPLLTEMELDSNLKIAAKTIANYIQTRRSQNKPIKILVTYDSFKYVRNILDKLNENLRNYHVVVDEFQSIFTDSSFKSEIELSFTNALKTMNNVYFVSATPMMEDYLDQVETFKVLPYYELDWVTAQPERLIRPFIKTRRVKSIVTAGCNIIKQFQDKQFETVTVLDTTINQYRTVQAKEVVFYINSVTNIISLIKYSKLQPNEVNILCADTRRNRTKIKKRLGTKYKIGTVPLMGEKRKMFTFCTRTVYLGADFYSDCARTIILSDSNITSMTVDISLDIPQIMGRQRLGINPWKNIGELYYIDSFNTVPLDQFNAYVDQKIEKTNNLIKTIESIPNPTKDNLNILLDKITSAREVERYEKDYSVVFNDGHDNKSVILNNLVLLAERRAWEIQNSDYTNTSQFASAGLDMEISKVSEFFDKLKGINTFIDQLKLVCEYKDKLTDTEFSMILTQVPTKIYNIINQIGVEKCRALSYNITDINKYVEFKSKQQLIVEDLQSKLVKGKRYTSDEIKDLLRESYLKFNLNIVPKVKDFEKYFEGKIKKNLKTRMPDGSRMNTYELI
jgi:hypothetical protein